MRGGGQNRASPRRLSFSGRRKGAVGGARGRRGGGRGSRRLAGSLGGNEAGFLETGARGEDWGGGFFGRGRGRGGFVAFELDSHEITKESEFFV